VFRLGSLKDSSLVARRILTYRHQPLASPAYLEACEQPKRPQDLLNHRLLSFSHWKPGSRWTFVDKNGKDKVTLAFHPFLAMNDYAGLAPALLAGGGIGELVVSRISQVAEIGLCTRDCFMPLANRTPAPDANSPSTATGPSGSCASVRCP
jgi:LysR substrate binding domain